MPLRIFSSIFNMESDRQVIEDVFPESFIIVSTIQKQSFFICKMEIIFNFIVKFDLKLLLIYFLFGKLGLGCIICLVSISIGVICLLSGLFFTSLELFLLVSFCRVACRGRSHSSRETCSDPILFDTWLLIWVLAKKGLHMVDISNLSPHEVDLIHLIFIVLNPPVSILEEWPYHYRVITHPNVISIHWKTISFTHYWASWLRWFEVLGFRWCIFLNGVSFMLGWECNAIFPTVRAYQWLFAIKA